MPPTIPGGGETDGLTTRDLVLEVRADVKELLKANLIERVTQVESSQRWFTRTTILQLLLVLGTIATAIVLAR